MITHTGLGQNYACPSPANLQGQNPEFSKIGNQQLGLHLKIKEKQLTPPSIIGTIVLRF
ncbi:hypothetical protein FD41_GL001782 [Lentilactobacillus farraginis DSM 18382 = JCM 14108]|uniref:Uncharacterized protein n=1 Tax=Lentilactobacillus farraginis DSM 18382 = JCM 14108 TaxID=1423743 RepID=X0QEH9_9LACO|nr:hypothetical protein FD41_GL001782 [Lentilactobacillus farraginis DSM 18382 = JCM 14108]GAF37015.1 hypothetical protein JCM14108_2014 [Lentilactobacillus farraginis DSM 18382 = JCM 14108]